MQALHLLLVHLGFSVSEIISGIKTKPHSHPYMTHLEIITDKGYVANCGGFLISQEFVLTAAHCKGRNKQKESTWQKLDVKEQIIHPEYSFSTSLNDIMLLKLPYLPHPLHANLIPSGPLHSIYWGSPCLRPSTFILPGRMCRVAGCGGTTVTESVLMDDKSCNHFLFYSRNLHICVDNPRKRRSAFSNPQGNSGGPLLCAGVAQGIVSYGHTDAKPPGIVTRIFPYVL
uniref:Peptidase S1 domain-containing protein n=1 Tax=Sus scrofa TaxID=9823 RepID=A0A8D1G3G4_PIG